jgi:integrase
MVIGKRGRERTVPVSPATVAALRAHWRDRGLPFDESLPSAPLLAPLVVPRFRAAETRHGGETVNGYTTHGVWKLVRLSMTQASRKGEPV